MTLEQIEEMASQERQGHGPWSHGDMLLAEIRDHLAFLRWERSDGSGPPPAPYPRPGVQQKSRQIDPRVEAYLREVERLHGASPSPDWWASLIGDSDG